ncbi:hypothetical protein GGP72_003312 [Salinibacter ruber]|uniref:Uncharacterized protein n=1 Tax=Salinibacter ruber TaxID=146919 RepID=A0A9X2Q2R8_9BACT|nr:hypothetical protein [Salinibacter ruber]MCS3682648.1 hypothetical protein [Salinibacter ruber]
MPCKPPLQLGPALRLGKCVPGPLLDDLPKRKLPCALESLVLPVRNAPPPLTLLLAHHVSRGDPAPLLLDLSQDLHVFVVVERVAPKLLPPGAHAVGDNMDVRVVLISVRRDVGLVVPQAPLLQKRLRVGDHLLVGDLGVLLRVADRGMVSRLLCPGPLLGGQFHLSPYLTCVATEEIAPLYGLGLRGYILHRPPWRRAGLAAGNGH